MDKMHLLEKKMDETQHRRLEWNHQNMHVFHKWRAITHLML